MDEAGLAGALERYGLRFGLRRISPGDEAAFGLTAALPERRRASGAARIVARRLLDEIGFDADAPLNKGASGAVIWPEGAIGSLAHDETCACALVGRRGGVIGVGVDIEPAEPLPADLVEFVLHGDERRHATTPAGRLVFAAKEAVYKAIHSLDATPLEYADIAVDLEAGRATLADGRGLALVCAVSDRVVAAAIFLGS